MNDDEVEIEEVVYSDAVRRASLQYGRPYVVVALPETIIGPLTGRLAHLGFELVHAEAVEPGDPPAAIAVLCSEVLTPHVQHARAEFRFMMGLFGLAAVVVVVTNIWLHPDVSAMFVSGAVLTWWGVQTIRAHRVLEKMLRLQCELVARGL